MAYYRFNQFIDTYLVEEFFYSALEVKHIEWAHVFLKFISQKFPQSVKSLRLLAMFHESEQDLDKARAIYNELLSVNANDNHALKRLVAMDRDRGRLNEAIQLLNQYLENNQQDAEAWIELTEIYLSR
jgi:tetratricopeptide (TPR) repeat protein